MSTSPLTDSRNPELAPERDGWRRRLHTVIFEADTPAGRAFDLILIALVALSVAVVCMETVGGLPPWSYRAMRITEWTLTVIFSVEYLLRLVAVRRPAVYAASFYGIVDLLAIAPTWISLFVPGARVLMVVRVLRLLRVFRVLKLTRFLNEARTISTALQSSSRKISVFLLAVMAIVIIVGSFMYIIEGPERGFTSIPRSMYWAVVTLTTVGYGDISPKTAVGQALASFVMILGYGVLAVPTGIVSAELAQQGRLHPVSTQVCDHCGVSDHSDDATFCRKCGASL
ncbi:MAG: ion transporter [Gemmatimonadaceae bacterium]|nr:ion transporter [Gemmatimonadaceae bacterium]